LLRSLTNFVQDRISFDEHCSLHICVKAYPGPTSFRRFKKFQGLAIKGFADPVLISNLRELWFSKSIPHCSIPALWLSQTVGCIGKGMETLEFRTGSKTAEWRLPDRDCEKNNITIQYKLYNS
jgi:hypothetical protein